MKYLKTLWTTLTGFFHKYENSEALNASTKLGRYLNSRRFYSEEKKRVKPNAFLPSKNANTDQLETSLFNIDGLSETQIKKLALKFVLPNLPKGRSIYGTGITNAKMINDVGLQAIKSEPPERHVNIVDWPNEKSEQKLFAMELCKMVELLLFENELIK